MQVSLHRYTGSVVFVILYYIITYFLNSL